MKQPTPNDPLPTSDERDQFPELVRCLALDVCAQSRVAPREFSREALTLMRALPWRDNPTELRDLIARVMTSADRDEVRLEEVLDHVRIARGPTGAAPQERLKDARRRFEREYIRAVLDRHGWRMSEAARALGIQRPNLYRKARALGILRPARSEGSSDRRS
ncbi:MAG TPA: helix-turn-helix domain-containing protein [Vicinamibacterales bacterium]